MRNKQYTLCVVLIVCSINITYDLFPGNRLSRTWAHLRGYSAHAINREIFEAARVGNVARIEELLGWLKTIQASAYNINNGALIVATLYNRHAAIQALIAGGININQRNSVGSTALMWAVTCGRLEIVTMLIEHGAQVNGEDRDGTTALKEAAFIGHQEITRMLIAAGAQVNAQSKDGTNALLVAVARGNIEIVRILLDAGASGSVERALQIARSQSLIAIAQLLSDHLDAQEEDIMVKPCYE